MVDEAGGGVGAGGDEDADGAVVVAVGDEGGDHCFVLKNLDEGDGGEGGLFASEELVNGFFDHFVAGGFGEDAGFEGVVDELPEAGTDEEADEETDPEDERDDDEGGNELVVAFGEEGDDADDEIGEGFDAVADDSEEPAEGEDENRDGEDDDDATE